MERPEQPTAHEQWLGRLRLQFLEVAGRRVPSSDVEDVVQDALRVVHARGASLPEERKVEGLPPVAWCFQVLRNSVGNYYKRRRRRDRVLHLRESLPDTEGGAIETRTPAEALETREATAHIEAALVQLAREDARCHGYVQGILAGRPPRVLAEEFGLAEAVFYRRLYRCRQKLRGFLHARGVLP